MNCFYLLVDRPRSTGCGKAQLRRPTYRRVRGERAACGRSRDTGVASFRKHRMVRWAAKWLRRLRRIARPHLSDRGGSGDERIMEDHVRERDHRGPDAAPSSSYVRVHQDEVTRRRSLPILGQVHP